MESGIIHKSNNKAVVIGAGIVGLTTACTLAEAGFNVTVLERENEPGAGTSKANAGQLLFNNISALASPSFLKSLPRTLTDPDQGVVVTGLLKPSNFVWLGKFIGQCNAKSWAENTKNILELAALSQTKMYEFNERHKFDYDWRKAGKLIIYPNEAGLTGARKTADFQAQFGGSYQILSKEQCFEREPALHDTRREIAGAIYLPDAEVGDCRRYCQNLAKVLVEKLNGSISFNEQVKELTRHKGRVVAVKTDKGSYEGDVFVISAGYESPKLLSKPYPGKKPLIGIKGISLTYPVGENSPNLSITDSAGKFVVLRLGDQVRVAGYAIFSDDLTIRKKHVQQLKQKAMDLIPNGAKFDEPPDIWSGLRPQTPDEMPMIGRAGEENLYINAGHGSTGWILAFGSAAKLTEKVRSDCQ